MRAKLEHVQQVLEVLTLKDHDKIGKQAREMSLLSQAATWQVLQTAEYRDRSMVFDAAWMPSPNRREKKTLKERQLAYKHASMTCVYCHN